jgi:predicted peroxiredoxin
MTLGDLLNTLASKIGKQNEQGLIDVLSRSEVSQITIPDSIANALSSELLSLDGAKNNAAVKSHFRAEALNAVDKEITNLVNEFGFDDEVFKTEKDTYAKIRALNPKIKTLLETKPDDNNAAAKAELQKQVVELNNKMAQLINDHKSETGKLKQDHEQQFLDWQVTNMLRNFNYANKDIPQDVNLELARTLLNKSLSERGVKIMNDKGALKLRQANDEALEYFDEAHKPVSAVDFVSKILADSKLLAVTDPPKGGTKFVPAVPQQGNNNNQMNTAKFDTAMAAAISDLNVTN